MRKHRRSTPPPAWQHALRRGLLVLSAGAAFTTAAAQGPANVKAAGASQPVRNQTAPSAPRTVTTSAQPTAPCARVEIGPPIQVSVGKSTLLKPSTPIERVLLGNPEGSRAARPTESKGKDDANDEAADKAENKQRPGVASVDVLLMSRSEVYLVGKTIGATNVVLRHEGGQCTAFDVIVTMDTASLHAVIAQLLPDEKNVRVTSAFDSIVLSGSVTDSGAVARVMDLANAYVRGAGGGASVAAANPRIVNMLSTGSPQQVMLEVKVAEVSKSLLDRFGINFARAYASADGTMLRFLQGIFGGTGAIAGQVSGTVGAVVGGGAVSSATNGQATSAVTAPFGSGTTDGSTIPLAAGKNTTQIGIDAQKNDGLVKILAEPNVMAISGQEGRFNAGGKIFIPVAQNNTGGGTTFVLEEKEFGVSVRFRPTVMDGGRINLEMTTEVSELNREGVGITAPGIAGLAVLPSFTSRKALTTVQLMDGQSFAIGGLIKNNTTTNIKAFPLLGELPVIGALFRSTEFQSDKSELVFVITPRLVKPLPAKYSLPTDNYVEPSRVDLHLGGRVEGRRHEGPPATPDAAPAPAAAGRAPAGGFQVK
jgi:pilus assembly protein CpaC